ncbi:uncharacterized protein C8R40DRAFT_637644 [Lentinula edodes]|uniref:uncharacterized protein n=1 Tax=Lentinula edodes TaxID=5353 RepID=UPI001E8CEEBD|nr:uncharacterized protein C8R40DRAFT_637644 [Lentinula edodes]KAH7870661.1 hypothetical protein C8R40DRAFT_637644 [Lentinula edodes]
MITPIVGKLRKRFFFDVSLALGLGSAAAFSYWYEFLSYQPITTLTRFSRYGYHLKAVERQEQYYLKLEREKLNQK